MMLHIKIQTECHATLKKKIEVLEKKYSGVHRIYR